MNENLIIQDVLFGSELYEQTVALRHDILRKPLGMEFTPEQLAEEHDSWHLAAFNEQGDMLACLILKPLPEAGIVKMRQVAVKASEQGKGLGSQLVAASEALALKRNRPHIVLHARETACNFYKRLNYSIVGDQFEEVGIPHYRMEKKMI
jgi:predicted GNAT family N-acyltransferase